MTLIFLFFFEIRGETIEKARVWLSLAIEHRGREKERKAQTIYWKYLHDSIKIPRRITQTS